MARTTLETYLGETALIEIATEYFGRLKTSTRIGEERGVPRQKVPRLALAGKKLATDESGPQPSS